MPGKSPVGSWRASVLSLAFLFSRHSAGNEGDANFAIVGGTGRYAGKTGTLAPKRRSCDGVAKEGQGDSLVVKFD